MIDQNALNKIKPGASVRVYEIVRDQSQGEGKSKNSKSKEKSGERISQFSGIVLARKHGSEAGASFTVRATIAGVGVEKVYPIHSPVISKVEILSAPRKVHRAKLYYLRERSKKQIQQEIRSNTEKAAAS